MGRMRSNRFYPTILPLSTTSAMDRSFLLRSSRGVFCQDMAWDSLSQRDETYVCIYVLHVFMYSMDLGLHIHTFKVLR